ncbi:hypothetical protein vseg_016235 [Gypsophila vaccaria]
MDTEKSSQNLPQFFKTLKPNSPSIPPKFNPNYSVNSQFNSPNQFNNQMGDQVHHKVSELGTIRAINRDFKVFPKTLIHESSPNLGECSSSGSIGVFKNAHEKNGVKSGGIVLKDDDFDGGFGDFGDECVFLKKETRKSLSPPSGKNKNDPICVDEIHEVDFEKKKSKFVDNVVHCVDNYDAVDDDNDDDVKIIGSTLSSKKNKRRGGCSGGVSVVELGESSGTKKWLNDGDVIDIDDSDEIELPFLCDICADTKHRYEWFTIKGCSHSYCGDCMKNYVASKLQDGVSIVGCPVPDCKGVLEPEYCREILPDEVFERWGNLLCESVLLASQKFYCPFKDCSALLLDDGVESLTQCECPSCFRLFCAQCKVGWHAGIECSEYQKLSKDEREKEDIMLRNLAKDKKWQRCPVCKFYVEKSEGCLYMKCRCGIAFCYSCGAVNSDHRYHNCKKCGR